MSLEDSLRSLLIVTLLLSYPGTTFARWLWRRARFREFAASHGLRFVGVIPSDKREPYTQFGRVSAGVLLYHVIEGRWNDFEIAVFDLPGRGRRTSAIVTVPAGSVIGHHARTLCESRPGTIAQATVGYLLVCAPEYVAPAELSEFLDVVCGIADALDLRPDGASA